MLPCGLARPRSRNEGTASFVPRKTPVKFTALAVPFVQARLLDAFAKKQAGIVDQDIEPAPSGDCSANGVTPVFLAGHIEMVKDRQRVAAAHFVSGVPAALVEVVTDHDARTRLDHQPRGLGPDAARRTGD